MYNDNDDNKKKCLEHHGYAIIKNTLHLCVSCKYDTYMSRLLQRAPIFVAGK